MSPLARSLLALAAAAAALLQGACVEAQTLCISADIGNTTVGTEVQLPDVKIGANIQNAVVDIPFGCQSIMHGERVTVCDDVTPVVIMPTWPDYTPATVHRQGNYQNLAAIVYVSQWCD